MKGFYILVKAKNQINKKYFGFYFGEGCLLKLLLK